MLLALQLGRIEWYRGVATPAALGGAGGDDLDLGVDGGKGMSTGKWVGKWVSEWVSGWDK